MNCIIIDDEPIARKGIRLLLEQVPNISVLGEFGNPLLAHDFIGNQNVDIIFLDIEMPGLSGLDYLRSLPIQSYVILTTAYPQYALEAFELDVIDYLVKPIKMDRFLKAVHKVKDYMEMERSELSIPEREDFIYVKSNRKYIKLFLKDILFIKGLKDYVIIQLEKHKYMTAMNVGTIGRQLPEKLFVRVSKSYIINVDHIQSIDLDSIVIKGHEIPLGHSYKEFFINVYVKGNLIKR